MSGNKVKDVCPAIVAYKNVLSWPFPFKAGSSLLYSSRITSNIELEHELVSKQLWVDLVNNVWCPEHPPFVLHWPEDTWEPGWIFGEISRLWILLTGIFKIGIVCFWRFLHLPITIKIQISEPAPIWQQNCWPVNNIPNLKLSPKVQSGSQVSFGQ